MLRVPALCDVNVLLALVTDRHWTDAYLAAYAHAARLSLVTFDKGFRGFPGLSCNVLEP